jgi:uncharacterized protein YhdP
MAYQVIISKAFCIIVDAAPIKEISPEFITSWDTSGKMRCMLTLHQPYHISRLK